MTPSEQMNIKFAKFTSNCESIGCIHGDILKPSSGHLSSNATQSCCHRVACGYRGSFCNELCQLNDVIYIRQGVQLFSIPNTTSLHLSVIFTFSATGMKMTMVLSYSAVIYRSTGI